jgi:hypothetical protein
MSNYKFISYTKTPEEKHWGIAFVSIDDKILLGYKIMPNKEGTNFNPLPASYKIDDTYVPVFTIDSNIQKLEIEALVRSCVKKHISSYNSSLPGIPDNSNQQKKQEAGEEIPF